MAILLATKYHYVDIATTIILKKVEIKLNKKVGITQVHSFSYPPSYIIKHFIPHLLMPILDGHYIANSDSC